MKVGTYIVHGLKYFLKLMVLLAAIYLLLYIFGQARISADQFVLELFTTRRGLLLFGALFVLAMVYPLFGFVRRSVPVDIVSDRDGIVNAFHAAGYSVREATDGRLICRAPMLRRVAMIWDDRITVTPDGDGVILEGIRKQTVQVEFRLHTYLRGRQNEKGE